MKLAHLFNFFLASLFFMACQSDPSTPVDAKHEYTDLVQLFKEWRTFETPPTLEGAPDYTNETFKQRQPDFKSLQSRLLAIDTTGWPINQKVDWMITWAEMNGYDFNYRILQPWVRDPAFYYCVFMERSDVPAHEGPTNHGTTEVWLYNFPLDSESKKQLIQDLQVIPPFYEQAKKNLTSNAKELWIAGVRTIKFQVDALEELLEYEGVKEDIELVDNIDMAINATNDLAHWLEEQAPTKTGPSGLGKENYTWYQQNVHLVPLTWDDEVMILKRELARAWSTLKLEEHHNRNLPNLTDANSEAAFDSLANQAANQMMRFLRDQEIVTVKDYWEPALRAHLGKFKPREQRNFFTIGLHYDPKPLYSHFYHWFELARMDNEPNKSEIRKGPLLYNIFDSRNEGTATAVEEMFMHAGLYDDSPRGREIVYTMIAQRAARGLGSLYAQANMMSMEAAGGIHSEFTPRGWMKTEKELLLFEQHLYMRQPGYGTSYITGKYLLEDAMADYAKMKESHNEEFKIRDFMDKLNAIGNIPISLGHWEMTGKPNSLYDFLKNTE